VLVTPTAIRPAARIDGISMFRDYVVPSFTAQWNLAGLPAAAVPCGFSAAGLPISMQIVGRPFEEATVLALAHVYQQHTDWHLRPVLGR
jgi:aspartyl-tRNA(Asn)/glutamyl-tRNA(Gln) amidotransferase subunit A